MAETNSYQPEPGDFQLNSLSFGEVAALLYSARKVTREMQSINKVKIPHMLKENMKWIVMGAESQPVMKFICSWGPTSSASWGSQSGTYNAVCDVSDTEKMKDVKKFLQSKSVISLAFF